MAASGYTPIQLYRTSTSGASPTSGNLNAGELAINYNTADMSVWALNTGGSVVRLMNNPAGLKYPTADGTANYVLKTDGAGTLSWTSAVTSVTGTAPVVSSGGTTPAISMAAATTSVNGYLTSTDWTTFNGKLSTTGGTMTGNIVFNSGQPLGTPSSGDLSSCTNAVGYGLKSATTTVSVSAATAPTTGQVLMATGSTAATWQTPGGPSAMVFLSTVTASAVATADIETTFDSTYDTYLLVGSGITVSSNGTGIECRMKIGGTYVTSGTYDYHLGISQSSADTYLGTSGSAATSMYIVPGIYNASGAGADFSMHIYNPSSTALQKFITSVGVCRNNSTTLRQAIFCGVNSGTAALTGIRLFVGTGTLSGTFRLYGIAKS